ncbi:MAG TPA: hypothetical protein VG963_00970, partial [Polyangiaceae bacterium]|nr:hypothetical protein [Polyangiaceae bacterium]
MAASGLRADDQDCSEALRSAGLGCEWLSVAPPLALDLLVRERLHRALERERPSLASERDHVSAQRPGAPAFAPRSQAPALAMPVVERWVYALGLIS